MALQYLHKKGVDNNQLFFH